MKKFFSPKILSCVAVTATLVCMSGRAMAGEIIAGATGLASPAETITFDEVVLPGDTAITTQYSGLGVTFSPDLVYNSFNGAYLNEFPNIDGNYAGNFSFTQNETNPTSINFTSIQTSAAFAFISNTQNTTFTALLNGVPVDSFTTTTGSSSNDFYGFTGESFNQITITLDNTSNNAFLIDNIQLSSNAVPEPSTFALLSMGGIGLAIRAVRRRRLTAAA